MVHSRISTLEDVIAYGLDGLRVEFEDIWIDEDTIRIYTSNLHLELNRAFWTIKINSYTKGGLWLTVTRRTG